MVGYGVDNEGKNIYVVEVTVDRADSLPGIRPVFPSYLIVWNGPRGHLSRAFFAYRAERSAPFFALLARHWSLLAALDQNWVRGKLATADAAGGILPLCVGLTVGANQKGFWSGSQSVLAVLAGFRIEQGERWKAS
jgi:hypothetical protein